MDNPENPTEPETPEPFTLPLEHDEDSEPENTISQPTPIQVKGSEEISLRYNGVEISLGSSRVDVGVLCTMALAMYYELKGIKQGENGKYIG